MKRISIIICIGFISVLLSCHSGDRNDPFTGFDAFADDSVGQRVEAYHHALIDTMQFNRTGKPSLYIDFSSGIYDALALPINDQALRAVHSALSGNLDVFKLANDSIIATADDRLAVAEYVRNKQNYNEIYAPIGRAVEKIVQQRQDAILITDFEEYTRPKDGRREIITDFAYLKESFINWISAGNRIYFFVSDYKEGANKIPKHLYFTIFSYGSDNQESILTRIDRSGALKNFREFELSDHPFRFTQAYPSQKAGGIFYDSTQAPGKANVLDLKQDRYVNGLRSNSNFEFYPIGVDWKTIAALKDQYNKAGQFNDFFRKLFLDSMKLDSYRIDGISVNVTDVSSDFEQFAKCRTVLAHPPHIVQGTNGENKIDEKEKDQIAVACYDADGKVKKEWLYHPKSPVSIPEFFKINKTLFDNTLHSSSGTKAEIGISFDPRFSAAAIPESSRLLRIDLVVSAATVNFSNPATDAFFRWPSLNKSGEFNSALANSISNALNEPKVKPEGKVIYSYYIKILAN